MNGAALPYADLALAGAALFVNGLISVAFGLRLERSLAIAVVRMMVQLSAIGFALKFVFAQTSLGWTAAFAFAMVAFAGVELALRDGIRLRGWLAHGLGTGALLLVGGVATLYALLAIIRPEPWHSPRYALPILGMVLGNVLMSVSLALRTMGDGVASERAAIDARLAQGASRFTAFNAVLRRSLRTAATPLLTMMAAAGFVAMPDMMAGQLLAGADPVEAAKYQIIILSVVSAASALGALGAALGSVLLLTDRRHRLRLERLTPLPGRI
jgi:putative ABC transport system permease protein